MRLIRKKNKIFLHLFFRCVKLRVSPLRYLFLNLEYIDKKSGVYSKYVMNQKVPKAFHLKTTLLDADESIQKRTNIINHEFSYPFFLKPEWSQKSRGVHKITNDDMLEGVLHSIKKKRYSYICQEAALEKHEYDIFIMESKTKGVLFFSCARSVNAFPQHKCNSVKGVSQGTEYKDETHLFSLSDQKIVQEHIRKIGVFKMVRISIAANSLQDIVAGHFHVIELNLFTPFPLHILDTSFSKKDINARIRVFTDALVESFNTKKSFGKKDYQKCFLLLRNCKKYN